jgi:hypothetical protein
MKKCCFPSVALLPGLFAAILLAVTAVPMTSLAAERVVLGEYLNALW